MRTKPPLHAKLTEAQVMTIREKLARGAPVALLARIYDVTPVCIHDIKRGKTWKHLLLQTHATKTAHNRNVFQSLSVI